MREYIAIFFVSILAFFCSSCSQPSKPDIKAQPEDFLQLSQEYFDESLALEPIYATFVGVMTYNNQFGESLSDSYIEKKRAFHERYLKRLNHIQRDTLNLNLRLSYDLLRYDLETALAVEQYPDYYLPMNQMDNMIFLMLHLASGESVQPFKTEQDFDNWFQRMEGFIEWLERAHARMAEGLENRVVLPQVLVKKLIPQIKAHVASEAQKSDFYRIIEAYPKEASKENKIKFQQKYQQLIEQRLLPSLKNLTIFLEQQYFPFGRKTDGWWGLPQGKNWYQSLISYHTTTTLTADAIHQTGLDEVQRIHQKMRGVQKQMKIAGSLQDFFKYMTQEPKFMFKNRDDLIKGYQKLKAQIALLAPNFFAEMPHSDYTILPVEPYRERSAAGASYYPPAVDGSRPGIFYINTFDLTSQPRWGMATLSLHEAIPGHHYQIALAQEFVGLPEFQRFSSFTAYDEGWALYAESLGYEMGLYEDPEQHFGHLNDELLRAMRLVVDTGLHAKAWTREQAIAYMLDNSAMVESNVVAEVERYMALPGQALAYKVGQLKISSLRQLSEEVLTKKFDIKEFHSQVLNSGALPMKILEAKVQSWLQNKQVSYVPSPGLLENK